MKILFITRKYPPQRGGMETFSANLFSALQPNVTLIALAKPQWHLVWWLPYAFVAALVKARSVDAIHLGDGLLAGMGVWLKWLTRKPVSVTVHGLDITYKPSWYQRYIRWALPKLQLAAVSEPTAELVKQRGWSAEVIRHGIKVEDWPLNNELGNNKCVLYVGRMVERKGCAWFIEHVLPSCSDVHLHVVGEGEQLKRCKELVQNLNLSERVKFHGNASPEQLRSHYANAQALIMPNLVVTGDVEGFGIVAIEAAACGLPVLASNLEGIRAAVIDGETGFLVESASKTAWIQAVQRIMQAPFSAQAVRNSVAKHYGLQHMADHYYHFFSTII